MSTTLTRPWSCSTCTTPLLWRRQPDGHMTVECREHGVMSTLRTGADE